MNESGRCGRAGRDRVLYHDQRGSAQQCDDSGDYNQPYDCYASHGHAFLLKVTSYRFSSAGLPFAMVQTAGRDAKLPLAGAFVSKPAVPS